MILRIYALYGGNTTILLGPALIIIIETIMMGLPLYLTGKSQSSRGDPLIAYRRHCQAVAEDWFI